MRIKAIHLQNYKGFKSAERIEVNGKNLLVYGNNGSGKSSLYQALRHLLQSSTYDQAQIEEHFATGALNCNIFCSDDEPAYVRLVIDDENETTYTFALDGNTVGDVNLQLANQASDFMNYRLLYSFYNFRNSEEADLFPIFRDEFFPYWTDLHRQVTYKAWYQQLQTELRELEFNKVRRNDRRYKDFEKKLETFNDVLTIQLRSLIETANYFLRVYFLDDELITVSLVATGFSLDPVSKNRFVLHPPTIRAVLSNYHGVENIDRPHMLLNEARLTALALSLRFAAFENFLKDAPLKILVLDDLLISLDMSLRMQVIKTILGQFRDYQLIIMTHDRSFFNVVRQNLALKEGWSALEFYENQINGQYANPLVLSSKDSITKAEEYLEQKDYEACALYLRKKAEELIRIYFDPTLENLARFTVLEKLANALSNVEKEDKTRLFNQFAELMNSENFTAEKVTILKAGRFTGDGTLTGPLLGEINDLRTQIFDFVGTYYAARDVKQQKLRELINVVNKVNEVRSRALNLGAHYTDEPLFETELQEALDILKQFEQEVKAGS